MILIFEPVAAICDDKEKANRSSERIRSDQIRSDQSLSYVRLFVTP